MELNSATIDSISKLSVEVIAIICLGYVIWLMSKAVNKLADSNQILASAVDGTERATEKISLSNEKLVEMVKSTNQLNQENINVTRELVDSLKRNRCPAVAKSRS